ncbi:hypothetical protein BH24ACT15_BH24ACT15_00500 [soil metagenome]
MPMATSVPHVQEALAEQLSGESDVVAAYLFGSLATGGASSDSDVDVAVLLRTPPSPARHLELIDLVQQTVGPRRADLVILNQAPLTLAYQVLRDGQVLTGAAHPDRLEHWVHTSGSVSGHGAIAPHDDQGFASSSQRGTFWLTSTSSRDASVTLTGG